MFEMAIRRRASLVVCLTLLTSAVSQGALAASAREMYASAMSREKVVRAAMQESPQKLNATALRQVRAVVSAYEAIVRRFPASGYCDNALWQAAALAADAFARSAEDLDKRTAVRLFYFLAREYPASPYAGRAAGQVRRLESAAPAEAPNAAKGAETNGGREASAGRTPNRASGEIPASPSPVVPPRPESPSPAPSAGVASVSTIRTIRRTVLAEVVRVTIELDREVTFRAERVENPARLLFDLPGTKATAPLQDANWAYQDDIVRHIRLGRHPNQTTRVVLDLDGVSRYTVVTLYNPYRILIDCERTAAAPPAPVAARGEDSERGAPSTPANPTKARSHVATEQPPGSRVTAERPAEPLTASKATSRETPEPPTPAPEKDRSTAAPEKEPAKAAPAKPEKLPAATAADGGRVSIARQLGLGIARVVIDPGHGGKDPGAEGPGKNEAEIVLDVALRLEKLLAKQPGIDVVLTRRTDAFVALEERTEIANREQADLFLSIHANASRNQSARGVESYYLNVATNPDAEAVAARENAASERTMNSLPDIVKAITLNNKLNESKDFASLVQDGLARRLRSANKSFKNLGVKQAPFVVLIGAAMPSVLVEVSFLTNQREGQLLRTEAYRQRIAEALADAIVRYKKNLKSANVVAHQ